MQIGFRTTARKINDTFRLPLLMPPTPVDLKILFFELAIIVDSFCQIELISNGKNDLRVQWQKSIWFTL